MRASTETLIAEYENLIALMKQENGVTEFEYFSTEWRDCNNPILPSWESPDTKFRVKQKLAEGWAWKYPNGVLSAFLYEKKQPNDTNESGRFMILLREVTK